MSQPPLQTGVDDVHAHPRHTGHRWVDMVIALSAITISVISLFVAIGHGRIEERLVAANSWPFPVFSSELHGSSYGSRLITLQVKNGGIGPARIQSVRLLLDGRPMHNRVELLRRCCGPFPDDLPGQTRMGLQSDAGLVGVLPARESVTFLTLGETPSNKTLFEALLAAQPHLIFSACYCSVLGACWTSDLISTTDPTPVAQCRSDPDGYRD